MARRFVGRPDTRGGAGTADLAVALGAGHVHSTWIVGDVVVQRLNGDVFPDVPRMVGTVVRVCDHLRSRCWELAPRPVLTGAGEAAVADGEGRLWRAFATVQGASSPIVVATPAVAAEVGRALGSLLVELATLPPPPPTEAIPGFKDFVGRRDAFEAAVAADPHGRAAPARAEVEAVRRHHHLVDQLVSHLDGGRLPPRVVHNDAKAANVLLDATTGWARAVVDLDTVASGTVLFDAGDVLRSTAVPAPEDARSSRGRAAGQAVVPALLQAGLGAWLAAASAVLDAGERGLMPLAGPLMAYESALRFLTDHLDGDRYFRVQRPGHNLDRARAQLGVLAALVDAVPLVESVSAEE